MALVFAGICSHGPGITGRAERADPELRDPFYAALDTLRADIEKSGAEAIMIIAAEHFANFFMDNMPAYAIGMGEEYEGPIEDPDWLKIPRTKIPGAPDLSQRIVSEAMQTVDVSYAQEWKMDHGIMVPLHFLTPKMDIPLIPANINCQGPPLTPLHRAYEFGRALRRAIDAQPEKIALMGTGGISHWPATPNSGKINVEWDREFLKRWAANDREALLSYTDENTLRDAGQGGFEIRTLIALAGACEGSEGDIRFAEPIPIFSTMCVAAVMKIGINAD